MTWYATNTYPWFPWITSLFNMEPARNTGTLRGLISTTSPVLGFLLWRPFRSATAKVPPHIKHTSPVFNFSEIESMIPFSAFALWQMAKPDFSEIFSTSSPYSFCCSFFTIFCYHIIHFFFRKIIWNLHIPSKKKRFKAFITSLNRFSQYLYPHINITMNFVCIHYIIMLFLTNKILYR